MATRAAFEVPLVDLRAQHAPLRDEILAALARVADSGQYILGPEVEAFERELAAFVGVPHAVGVSSGTDALLVALMALGVGPGDEVVVPALSFVATASVVARLGAVPRFADIDPATFTLDPAALERAVGPRTRAVVPVHLYGLCADMEAVVAVADRRGLPVVEDAAQALGARCGARQAGATGRVGCFSFFPTKHLGALGDAGLLVTADDGLAETARLLRVHGAERRDAHRLLGGNFRLDAIQAAVLRVKLPHVPAWIDARRANARRYADLFRTAGLDGIVRLPVEPPGRPHTWHQYVVRAPRRDALRAHLAARGIGTEVYYAAPLHLQPCFAALGHRPGDFPEAERASAEVLALPVWPGLDADRQARVVEAMAEFYRGA
jgi:dTDP-4-amino-4,6-dideoxygalactose transaminase